MARAASKIKMGYLPIDEKHHEAILSLIPKVTPAHRLLDPFAGEGVFLEKAAQAWGMTPYANELDADRALACLERFGPTQAVQCDVERLRASNGAFSIIWCNPPYDIDAAATDSKRVEFKLLRHSWKWAAPGGLVLWVIYKSHLTQDAAKFLARHSSRVDVWALPGKHQNVYDQIIVAAIPALVNNTDVITEQRYAAILQQKAAPVPLTRQAEPVYSLPPPPDIRVFHFAPDIVDETQGLRLIQEQGAWQMAGFQALLAVPKTLDDEIEPVVPPRPGHMALVLGAGVANGAIIDTEYGRTAIRSKITHVEEIARIEREPDYKDPEQDIIKTTTRLKPVAKLAMLTAEGGVIRVQRDEGFLDFVKTNRTALAGYLNTRFKPLYQFDFTGLSPLLNPIRLKGKYPLYTAQKHVVGAIVRGFQQRDGILLSGEMGVGKSAMGSAVIKAMTRNDSHFNIRPDQVVLLICPPHLIDKWKRELLCVMPKALIRHLKRHEDVKAFMTLAETAGDRPKIGLIKRDMTKLGSGTEPAVVWRDVPVALWSKDEWTPDGYTPQQRISKRRTPQCPSCGGIVYANDEVVASESWLKSKRRTCARCHHPLWQDARDTWSKPKPGEKYPSKNPRFRLDQYIKKQYPDRIYLLIWDELHEAAHSDTGNGEALNRLGGLAHKVLGLTGTPFNGRSSSIFNIEYVLNPKTRTQYPWGGAVRLTQKDRESVGIEWQHKIDGTGSRKGQAESDWVSDMGVRESVEEERPNYDPNTGAYTGTSTYQRPFTEAPGISPLLIGWMLDHTVYFSLKDLGKHLPQYDEIAVPIPMTPSMAETYKGTQDKLKDYLNQLRWEGDVSFRGAYLQWAMGWPNAAWRQHDIIHNIRHPVTKRVQPHIVESLPAMTGIPFTKEETLVELVRDELDADRPVVIYLRQTGSRDIQPRIEQLLKRTVPRARPYILKARISAERREQVIEKEIGKGVNILITNPELVRTGLDLIHFPTLIYFEITFNLSTMMQAAARSYRLNQTHPHCKTIFLYYEETMEHTAVQLMSRKQRAAKLMTGDIGLTGLDVLTEGEGGFESALLDAIGKDETLLDPAEMFKQDVREDEISAEDAAFWNVEEGEAEVAVEPEAVVEVNPVKQTVEWGEEPQEYQQLSLWG